MWRKKSLLGIILFLLLSVSAYSQEALSQDAIAEDPPTASEEILQIADGMLSIADRLDLQQSLLESLTKDLEEYQKDFPKLQLTLDQMRRTYESLSKDYERQQFELKIMKTTTITFGVGFGITTIALIIVATN